MGECLVKPLVRLALFLLPITLAADAGPAPQDATQPSVLREALFVRRVHRPILIVPKKGAGESTCAKLDADQVRVFEDEERLRSAAIGPRPLPRVHALLVDTSYSMLDELSEAKRAAVAYVESLPEQDAVLLAAFDESMVLGSPPTTDRRQLREAIEGLSIGRFTSLWDALTGVVRYMATLHGEKIVVVVSDGRDTTSLGHDVFERLLELITATPDLAVFPIALDRSPGARAEALATAARLEQIAARTGGELFRIHGVDALAGMLQRIQSRLDSRIYVSYVPRAFGEGPRDNAAQRDHRWRRVRVDTARGVPCRVVFLGYPQRLESRTPASGQALVGEAIGPGEGTLLSAAMPAACRSSGRVEIAEKLRLAPAPFGVRSAAPPGLLYTSASRERLIGRTTDVIVERGPLFKSKSYWEAGKYRTAVDRKPISASRVYVVETPPLAQLQRELNQPEGLLLYMLRRDLCAPIPTRASPHVRSPWFVHGRTFLELRDFLGRVLYRAYPDYRDWAAGRVAAEVDSDLGVFLEASPQARDLTRERVLDLRRALLLRATDADEGRAHLYLSEWLGDLSATDTVRSLERSLMERLLSGEPDPEIEAQVNLVAGSWHKLAAWFAPATAVRIVTPLVPVYDPRRDLVGFYRFVLPRPTMNGKPDEVLGGRPLGLLTLRWLLNDPAAAALLEGRARITSVEAARTQPRETRGWHCGRDVASPAGRRKPVDPRHKLAISLEGPGSDPGSIRLEAYFLDRGSGADGAADRPACIRVVSDPGSSSEWASAATEVLTHLLGRPDLTASR